MKYPHALRALLVMCTLAVSFAAAPAEARFGKRSEPQKSEHGKKESKVEEKRTTSSSSTSRGSSEHRATPARPSRQQHAATPVRNEPVYVESHDHDYGHDHYHDAYCGHSGYVAVHPAPVYGYTTYEQPYVHAEPQNQGPSGWRFEAFLNVQPMTDGGMGGANLRIEGRRIGFETRLDALSLPAGDGTYDGIGMFDATLSYALLSSDQGRLRAHAGLYTAVGEDVAFAGPGAGLSASLNLIGPFTADAGAHLVLVPFTKIDTYGALGLRLSIFEVRGGVRLTVLGDQGRVDGVPHTDAIAGPYLSLGLVL